MLHRIDPKLRPKNRELTRDKHGRRPVAAVADEHGVVSEFVANELIVESEVALKAVLAATGGIVVRSDAVPDPPHGLDGAQDVDRAARMWVIRVDASQFPLDSFDADAAALGSEGEVRVSSQLGARLLAMAASLARRKLEVALNFVMTPGQLPMTKSNEGFGIDALTLPEYQATGCKSCVTQAWQFIQAYQALRPTSPIRVAIIDDGFWLDPAGKPLSAEGGASDLPAAPIQYDFRNDDYLAGGASDRKNSQGQVTPWHGNGSASVAAAAVNNGVGAAGTGGLVAAPMLFKVDLSHDMTARAVRTATAWGAHVISMSFGGSYNWWARTFTFAAYDYAFAEARVRGVVAIAAAGNDGVDAVDNNVMPCVYTDGVICVGAINNSNNMSWSGSNYGSGVMIWAPTGITAIPDGNNSTPITFGGTSAATPFVAGVVAMMKAIDPILDSRAVGEILQRVAWHDSPDPKVSTAGNVNAFAALLEAAKHQLPPDRFEQNNDRGRATGLTLTNGSGAWNTLAISSANDVDWYRVNVDDYSTLDVNIDYVQSLGQLTLTLFSDEPDGSWAEGETNSNVASGRQYHADIVSPGNYVIQVRGGAPNLYDLRIRTSPAALQPDEFEVNDTLQTAAALSAPVFSHWMKQASIHIKSDVDYYRLDVKLGGPMRFDFDIAAADMDVTLRLFDTSGTELQAAGPSRTPTLQLGNGTSIVKVESARRGRYTFEYGYTITDPHLRDGLRTDSPFFYDPSDPEPRWHIGERPEYLVFTATRALVERTRNLALSTPRNSLHIQLLTTEGHVIAEGEGEPQNEEILSLPGLEFGQQYAIKIDRNPKAAPNDGIHTVVPYQLELR